MDSRGANMKSVVLLYSKFSEKCKHLMRYIEQENQTQLFNCVCVDSQKIRTILTKSNKIKVKSVPSLLIIFDNGVVSLYEDFQVLQIVQEMTKNSPGNRSSERPIGQTNLSNFSNLSNDEPIRPMQPMKMNRKSMNHTKLVDENSSDDDLSTNRREVVDTNSAMKSIRKNKNSKFAQHTVLDDDEIPEISAATQENSDFDEEESEDANSEQEYDQTTRNMASSLGGHRNLADAIGDRGEIIISGSKFTDDKRQASHESTSQTAQSPLRETFRKQKVSKAPTKQKVSATLSKASDLAKQRDEDDAKFKMLRP